MAQDLSHVPQKGYVQLQQTQNIPMARVRADIPWIPQAQALSDSRPAVKQTIPYPYKTEQCLKRRGCLFSLQGVGCSRKQLKFA